MPTPGMTADQGAHAPAHQGEQLVGKIRPCRRGFRLSIAADPGRSLAGEYVPPPEIEAIGRAVSSPAAPTPARSPPQRRGGLRTTVARHMLHDPADPHNRPPTVVAGRCDHSVELCTYSPMRYSMR